MILSAKLYLKKKYALKYARKNPPNMHPKFNDMQDEVKKFLNKYIHNTETYTRAWLLLSDFKDEQALCLW